MSEPSETLERLEKRIDSLRARAASKSGVWVYLGPGHATHHVRNMTARRTTCGRRVESANHSSTEPGSNPCRRCWSRLKTDKPPQDMRHEEEIRMAAKTKKEPKAKGQKTIDELAKVSDPEVQSTEKMKKIRAERRVVKKHEIEIGNLKEATKIAREELEAARAELYRLIDSSGQGDLYVGTDVQHVSRETGEIEDEDLGSDE